MKKLHSIIILFFLVSVPVIQGCFKEIAEQRQPLPDIIWPKPPDIPRIRFVNSISIPEDLNISAGAYSRFLRFFRGETRKFLVAPYGLVADSEDRLFVVDNFNRYVHVYDRGNGMYYTFPGKETTLVSPIDIAIDKNGNIYVSDSKAAVVKIFQKHGKKYIKEIGKDIFKRPTGLAVNKKTGELLVIDTLTSKIMRFDIDTHAYKGAFGEQGSEPGMFHYPTNIFVSDDGTIYITDSLNFRIQIFSSEGAFLDTFGKPGDGPGYFARPKGVAVDTDGNIYVVDAIFDNVQIFNREGKLLMAFGDPGSGYGEFWLPSGIFIDSNNRIYVSDSYNKRVQVFQYMKGDTLLNP